MLKGKDLSLREYQKSDLPKVQSLLNNVSAGFDLKRGAGVHLTAHEVAAIMTKNQGPDVFRYIALDLADVVVGIFEVRLAAKDRRAELEHRMLEEHRMKGHDTEALKVILNILFNELNMNRCQTIIFDFEKIAFETFRNLGFTKEAALRHHVYHENSYHDAHVLGLLKDEYLK